MDGREDEIANRDRYNGMRKNYFSNSDILIAGYLPYDGTLVDKVGGGGPPERTHSFTNAFKIHEDLQLAAW